jgi:hypothetical protein
MADFFVRIDHLSNDELSFYGWEIVDEGGEFSTYWNARYNEFQPVANDSPRYIVVDDWNDAQAMSRGPIIAGP